MTDLELIFTMLGEASTTEIADAGLVEVGGALFCGAGVGEGGHQGDVALYGNVEACNAPERVAVSRVSRSLVRVPSPVMVPAVKGTFCPMERSFAENVKRISD